VLYFADTRWWEWHRERPDFKSFAGQKCTIENTGSRCDDPEIFMLHNDSPVSQSGLSASNNALRTGMNSGYQALGLAIAAGAARVVLLGYDMHFAGEKSHWHGGHPVHVGEGMYRDVYAKFFHELAPQLKVEVLNATPGSALTCFRRIALESLLPPAS
jgi:hypothetical protein